MMSAKLKRLIRNFLSTKTSAGTARTVGTCCIAKNSFGYGTFQHVAAQTNKNATSIRLFSESSGRRL
jgi:hypothetical protein